MSPSTGTCPASLWPPVKLYLAKPVHLAAAGGRPGVSSGAKSNEAIDTVSTILRNAGEGGSALRRVFVERCKLRHHFACKQRQRMHLLRVGERTEGEEEHQIVVPDAPGLGDEDARDRLGRAHDQRARGPGLIVVAGDGDGRKGAALDPQPGERIEPALVGAPRNALGFGIGIGDEHRAHDAAKGARDRRCAALALLGGGRPLVAEGCQHGGDLLVRPQRDPVHAVAGGECGTLPAAQPVPERRVWALARLHHDRNVGEVETPAVIVNAIAREPLAKNVEDVLEIFARSVEIDPVGFELHGRDAAANADVEAPPAQVIEHAQLLEQAQRMIERKQVKQRAEPDAPGLARGSGEKDAWRRRRGKRRGVVLGQMIAVEAGGLGRLQQRKAILEGLLKRLVAIVDVIEDAESHGASRCRVVQARLRAATHPLSADYASVPVPTFVSLCSTRLYKRRNQRDTSKYTILVWLRI